MARNMFILSKHGSLKQFKPNPRSGQKASLEIDKCFSGLRFRHFVFSKISSFNNYDGSVREPDSEQLKKNGFEKEKIFLDLDKHGVVVMLEEVALSILVPIGSSRQLFYRSDKDWIMVSDDPRMLAFEPLTRDPVGIVAALSFRAPLGSLSPWKEIRRLGPGIHWQVNHKDFSINPLPLPLSDEITFDSAACSTNREREDALLAVIDTVLERKLSHGPGMLLFSGGVDSGLLAVRASALGYKDLTLMHSSRGGDDAETVVARNMAKRLGMPFRSFEYSPQKSVSLLENIFDAYTLFADFSIMPTWQLAVDASLAMPDALFAMDGVGADSLFATNARSKQWKLLYRCPKFLRQCVSKALDSYGLWHKASKYENIYRAVKRSSVWPSKIRPYTLHALALIGFDVTKECIDTLEDDLQNWYSRISDDKIRHAENLLSALSIMSSKAVQKHYTPMDQLEINLVSPFLENDIAEFGINQIISWPQEEVKNKSILKRIMARSLPEDLVYRPKSGLSVDPIHLFCQPQLLAALKNVLEDSTGPLFNILHLNNNLKIYEKIQKKLRLPWYTYEYVWQLIFIHHWMINNEVRSFAD